MGNKISKPTKKKTSKPSNTPSPSQDQYILVMGVSGAGKTSFVNKISGSSFQVGDDIFTCTSEDQVSPPFMYRGRTVRMVDTSGFDDLKADDNGLRLDMHRRVANLGRIKHQLVGVIYMHDITHMRTVNSAIRMIGQFEKTIGKTAAQNVVIVTTKWDEIDPQVGNHRHARLSEHPRIFGSLTAKGTPVLKYSHHQDAMPIVDQLLGNA